MLNLQHNLRIYFATQPANMRLSFRGLMGLVRGQLREDPTCGHLFCFLNKRRTMMKLLLCDQTGTWIFHKRLSLGTFELPAKDAKTNKVLLDAATLSLILEGIVLDSVQRRKRYQRPEPLLPPELG
jgi:transposase